MMIGLFRGEREPRHEGKGFGKILEREGPFDGVGIALLDQIPARYLTQRLVPCGLVQFRHIFLHLANLFMSAAMTSGQTHAPDLAAIERLADAAIAALPAPFRDLLDGVVLQVVDFADDETLRAMGMDDPFELTGLYHGRPIGERDSGASGDLPPMITLYRRPLLDEWAHSGVTLEALITHVIVHEVGHHFGLSDADMHAIEDAA